MMQLDSALLCQSYAIDQASNSLSIFNVMEKVAVPPVADGAKNIALEPPFTLIAQWTDPTGESEASPQVRVRLKAPDGKPLGTAELASKAGKSRRYRTAITFPALPFAGLGLYQFIVDRLDGSRWRKTATVYLEVEAQEKTASA